MYKCVKCGGVIEDLPRIIRCPNCASKVFSKQRPPITTNVEAE